MKVRAAGAADIAGIRPIWNAVIRDTLITFNPVEKTDDDLAALLVGKAAQNYPFLVAEQEGRVAGFATYGQFRGGAGYARTMEHTIILAPAARGRGTGRALLFALEDHARIRGAHSMIAGISAANAAGVAFHAALGYVQVATLPEVGFKFGRWLDLVLMQKFL